MRLQFRSFFFFQPHLCGQVIYSPQLFNHLTDTTGATVRGAERVRSPRRSFTPPPAPRGVSHKCSGGSRVAISYLCVTYQSRLQPEKAITEFKPLAFVHSHSSLTNTHHTSRHTHTHTHTKSLTLLLPWRMCGRTKGEGGVTLMTSAERGWSLGHSSLFWERRSFHTHRGSFSPVLRGPWLRAHKELLISSEHIKKGEKKKNRNETPSEGNIDSTEEEIHWTWGVFVG